MDKGERAEEILRAYFLSLGYYVCRGILFRFDGFDVTDIDLWLYNRHSFISRERINVDVKNKKTPQAIERIFWAAGLRSVLGLSKCIVATTDKRPAVVEFGRQHNIVVLNGYFLDHIAAAPSKYDRFTEEELFDLVDAQSTGSPGDAWVLRVQESKSRLLTNLDFDGCNQWLKDIEFFLCAAVSDVQRREAALRAAYIVISHFLIGLDHTLARFGITTTEQRRIAMLEGFRHGSQGSRHTRMVSEILSRVSGGNGGEDLFARKLLAAAEGIRAEVLADHFSKPTISSEMFECASALEHLGYARTFARPSELPPELKSAVAVILDFLQIDRVKVL